MNNKAISEFGFRMIWRIKQISKGVIHFGLRPLWITPSSICLILHILLSLIHSLLNILLVSNGLDKRQLGSFPVSQVARCKCTLLAGNSPISLAGSVEQIRFSQQSPKMLKMASESIKHALLLFSGLFFNDSLWVPLSVVQQIRSLQVEKRCCGKSVNPAYGVTHA